MAYKSLENTFIYKQLNSDNRVSLQLVEAMQKGTILSKEHLEEQFLTITKNFKYPLKFKIMDEYQKGKILLLFSPNNVKLPLALPFFLTKNKDGEVVSVVVVDLFGTMNKNGAINIEAKKLYTLMEAAYFAKICYYFPKQVSSRKTVIVNGSSMYGNILTRVFNKKYALNIDKTRMSKFQFLANKFYMINLLGLEDNDTVNHYALQSCVGGNPNSIQEADQAFDPEGYKDFSTFITALKNPHLGFNFKDLQVRGILESYIQMYESSMLMALESFPYFFYNVLAVTNGAYMNNQFILEDIVDVNGAKIYADLIHIDE
jgi:hypothetical protein